MKDSEIDAQYSTGLSRRNIEQALIAAGKDLDHLQPADLGMLEDFHTMGRIATSQLAGLAKITGEDEVLDAGSGIGGTARFLAGHYGCKVTAIDLTEEYCETARWLDRLVGLDDRISVRQGNVTDLPFADATFQLVTSQHVQMNVPDKTRLYQEARRVLVIGGRPPSGTSPPGRPENSTIRFPGPTGPSSAISPPPAGCMPPLSPRGSQWTTGTTSPARRSRSWRRFFRSPRARWGCTPSSRTSPRKRRTSPEVWPAGGFESSRASRERSPERSH